MTVDLENQLISDDSGFKIEFEVDAFRKEMLLDGLDEIGLTLHQEEKISEFEKTRKPFRG